MSVVVVCAEGAAGLPRAHMAMVSVLGAVMLLVLWLETGAGGAPGFVRPEMLQLRGGPLPLCTSSYRRPGVWPRVHVCRRTGLRSLIGAERRDGDLGEIACNPLRLEGRRGESDNDTSKHAEGSREKDYVFFPQLSKFDSAGKLLDAVEPFFEKDTEGAVKLTGRNAAHVMNRLKYLKTRRRSKDVSGAECKREDAARALLVGIVSGKVDELALKHVALVLNAVKGSRGAAEAELVKTACWHAVALLEDAAVTGDAGMPVDVPAQTVAMLLNSLAMGAGGVSAHGQPAKGIWEDGHSQETRVVDRVFDACTPVLLRMPSESFNAQSISTIMNAYASADRWHLALFRRLGSMAVAMPVSTLALQPVAMIVNAYSRLMQQDHVVSAWDVEESDILLFQGMAHTAASLAKDIRHPQPSSARSVALIVNALAKVGVTEKHVFGELSGLLLRAQRADAASHVSGSDGSGSDLRYDAQAVSNIVNAFAKANVRDDRLFAHLAHVTRSLPYNSFSGQHVATILNGYARAGVPSREVFEFMSTLLRYWDRFGQLTPSRLAPQGVALILNAFARAEVKDVDLFERMARLVQLHLQSHADGPLHLVPSSTDAGEAGASGASLPRPTVPAGPSARRASMSPQAISNIVNACANGDFKAPELLQTLEGAIVMFDGSSGMTLQHVSCIANGMVRLGHAPPHLVSHLTKLARGMPRRSPSDPSGPLSLSLLANALCKSEVSDAEAFCWIAAEAQQYAANAYSAQSVAMLANSFARAGQRHHALFRHLCDVCMSLPAESFDEQSIANIANAFARNSQAWTKHANAAPGSYNRLMLLFQRLAHIATRPEMWAFNSQSVALIVNAYAKLGIKDDVLFGRLSRVAQQMGSRNFELPCKPLHVAQVCNAFAKANVHDARLFGRMSDLVCQQSHSDFDSRIIGIILNAYAQLRIRDSAAVQALSVVARSMPSSSFDGQAIGNIFHALASLDIRDDSLIDHMCTTILRSRQTIMQTEDYNGQALANIAWSMAVLQLSDVTLNRWICNMCVQCIGKMDKNALRQLHQYIIAHEVENLVPRKQLPELDALLQHRSRIEKAWDQHQKRLLSIRQRGTDESAVAPSGALAASANVYPPGDDEHREVRVGRGSQSHERPLEVSEEEDMCAGNEPVWVGDDEGGASGWMPVSLHGHGRSALLGQAKGGNGARRNDAGDIETGLGTGTDQVTSVDAEGQVDRVREAAWLKKTQARSGKHAHDTTGLGSSEEHGVAGGGERHISNLQLDVANTLRALLRGRRLVGRGQISGSSPDDADTMLELIDGAPEGHEVEVVEEATDKITGYDMNATSVKASFAIQGPASSTTLMPVLATVAVCALQVLPGHDVDRNDAGGRSRWAITLRKRNSHSTGSVPPASPHLQTCPSFAGGALPASDRGWRGRIWYPTVARPCLPAIHASLASHGIRQFRENPLSSECPFLCTGKQRRPISYKSHAHAGKRTQGPR